MMETIKNQARNICEKNQTLYTNIFKQYIIFGILLEVIRIIVRIVYFAVSGGTGSGLGMVVAFGETPVLIKLAFDFLNLLLINSFSYSISFIYYNKISKTDDVKNSLKNNLKSILLLSCIMLIFVKLPNELYQIIRNNDAGYAESVILLMLSILALLFSFVSSILLFLAIPQTAKHPEKNLYSVCVYSINAVVRNISKIFSFFLSFLGWFIMELLIISILGAGFYFLHSFELSLFSAAIAMIFLKFLTLSLCGIGFRYYPYFYTSKVVLLENIDE